MHKAVIAALVLLVLAAGVCIGSTVMIHRVLDQMEDLHEQIMVCTDLDDRKGALVALAQMGTIWSDATRWMEMLAPHEDIHTVREQIVSSRALLEHDDIAQYHQCMALLRESINHLRRHESMTLSNVF